jgi:hypothetical protein
MQQGMYPVRFSVDYPDRPLDRLATLFGLFGAVPILSVLGSVAGGSGSGATTTTPGRSPPAPAGCCSSGRC